MHESLPQSLKDLFFKVNFKTWLCCALYGINHILYSIKWEKGLCAFLPKSGPIYLPQWKYSLYKTLLHVIINHSSTQLVYSIYLRWHIKCTIATLSDSDITNEQPKLTAFVKLEHLTVLIHYSDDQRDPLSTSHTIYSITIFRDMLGNCFHFLRKIHSNCEK